MIKKSREFTEKQYTVLTNREEIYQKALEFGYRDVVLRTESLTDEYIQELKLKGKTVVLFYFEENEGEFRGENLCCRMRDAGIPFDEIDLKDCARRRHNGEDVTVKDAAERIPSKTHFEEEMLFFGTIMSADYEDRCGNCHARMTKEEKYCRHCGTKRGEGEFLPYRNIPECVYGPPVMIRSKCTSCGNIWITRGLCGDPSEFCPECGKNSVTELEHEIEGGRLLLFDPDEA